MVKKMAHDGLFLHILFEMNFLFRYIGGSHVMFIDNVPWWHLELAN